MTAQGLIYDLSTAAVGDTPDSQPQDGMDGETRPNTSSPPS